MAVAVTHDKTRLPYRVVDKQRAFQTNFTITSKQHSERAKRHNHAKKVEKKNTGQRKHSGRKVAKRKPVNLKTRAKQPKQNHSVLARK